MITPQTNATLEEIAQSLLRYERFCVCGHIKPDGDCIGSTLGLVWALRKLGKNATPLLAEEFELDPVMEFLPLSEDIVSAHAYANSLADGVSCGNAQADSIADFCDVFICVDVPNEARLGDAAASIKASSRLSVTVDHHADPRRMSDLSYTDPDAASTTMLVWELAKHLGMSSSTPCISELATCIYTGLSTDSGSFMNQNTDAAALRCACELVSCGADPSAIAQHLYQGRTAASVKVDGVVASNMEIARSKGGKVFAVSFVSNQDMVRLSATSEDAEHAVSLLRSIGEVDIACMLKEQEDGSVRGSFRAKDDTDVSAIAREFGGGGHVAAAGFTLDCSLQQALDKIRDRLLDIV